MPRWPLQVVQLYFLFKICSSENRNVGTAKVSWTATSYSLPFNGGWIIRGFFFSAINKGRKDVGVTCCVRPLTTVHTDDHRSLFRFALLKSPNRLALLWLEGRQVRRWPSAAGSCCLLARPFYVALPASPLFKATQRVAFEHLDYPPATSKARWLPLASVIDNGRRAEPSDNMPCNYNQLCLPVQLSQQGPEMNKK